jgi:hypothetical protein
MFRQAFLLQEDGAAQPPDVMVAMPTAPIRLNFAGF